ncbi:hypothetical protein [Nonomuraea sp. NPDC001831]|uniref:hypothetical protein n=1 Tax=Nonomuraea sp. NPDC001831 TaxID=3364340 RepID=UPI00369AD928
MSDIRIVGISGSLRARSHTPALLRAAQKHAPGGVSVDVHGGVSPANFGSVRAQRALRQVFVRTDSDVITKPEAIDFRAYERFGEDGNVADDPTIGLLQDLLAAPTAKAA